jgi:hypothetical protein
MNEMDLNSAAPLYIHTVRQQFEQLPNRVCVECVVELMNGSAIRNFPLSLPDLSIRDAAANNLAERYLFAEIYNILSSMGGRKMTFYCDLSDAPLVALLRRVYKVFGVDLPRKDRPGYGRCINVIDRMLAALYGDEAFFSFEIRSVDDLPTKGDTPAVSLKTDNPFLRATEGLAEKLLLGMDIGGTDIKLALVRDGKIVCFKEYDWFPALFTESRQLVDPSALLVRLMRAKAALDPSFSKVLNSRMAEAMEPEASDELMKAVCCEVEAAVETLPAFDGIGLCFPDVVIRDKVVGGEVYKTRGIRNNPAIDFESDFLQLTDLNCVLDAYCKAPGCTGIINDGPMAAFTAAVEQTIGGRYLSGGVFAHTLGTELGTGWVCADASIPDIPLEVYNCIIDLGSLPETVFDADDVRSLNNFNTGLAGTLQKYTSQSGVFRLAAKYFLNERPDLYQELFDKGFIAQNGERLVVPTSPEDMRKPFLEHMMELADREGDSVNERIWKEIGQALGVTWLETDRILQPETKARILFGRLVKRKTCFDWLNDGAHDVAPESVAEIADSSLANTPLMKQLEADKNCTVAQFAQAVGAVYYANEQCIRKGL